MQYCGKVPVIVVLQGDGERELPRPLSPRITVAQVRIHALMS